MGTVLNVVCGVCAVTTLTHNTSTTHAEPPKKIANLVSYAQRAYSACTVYTTRHTLYSTHCAAQEVKMLQLWHQLNGNKIREIRDGLHLLINRLILSGLPHVHKNTILHHLDEAARHVNIARQQLLSCPADCPAEAKVGAYYSPVMPGWKAFVDEQQTQQAMQEALQAKHLKQAPRARDPG